MRSRVAFAAGTLAVFMLAVTPAFAQKQGGTLKISHRDNPPSASIHEESTISVNLSARAPTRRRLSGRAPHPQPKKV